VVFKYVASIKEVGKEGLSRNLPLRGDAAHPGNLLIEPIHNRARDEVLLPQPSVALGKYLCDVFSSLRFRVLIPCVSSSARRLKNVARFKVKGRV
jgi:hypothetical protein